MLILNILPINAQSPGPGNRFGILFYNVENLFDTIDSPDTRDESFTPAGDKQWNTDKYWHKQENIFKVIASAGNWSFPDLIGLCEVENRTVLEDLVHHTPLKKLDYQIVHDESPDERGIDVALLYQKDRFVYLTHQNITTPLPHNDKTRDILYVCGKVNDVKVHLFVNHWPSRYGGRQQTQPKRNIVASHLHQSIESLCDSTLNPYIILMGDFNDNPGDQSLEKIYQSQYSDGAGNTFHFANLMTSVKGTTTHKTVNYNWYTFDQIMISSNMLQNADIRHPAGGIRVIDHPWLLDEHGRPYRSFLGNFYQNGYSDHLAVYTELWVR